MKNEELKTSKEVFRDILLQVYSPEPVNGVDDFDLKSSAEVIRMFDETVDVSYTDATRVLRSEGFRVTQVGAHPCWKLYLREAPEPFGEKD